MKTKIIFFLFLFFVFSCSSPEAGRYHTVGEYLLPVLTKDSAQVFEKTKFANLIDTLKYPGDVSPSSISLVEYYGISTYSISNIKCLLLEYPEKAVMNLFRYEYDSLKWEMANADTMTIDRFQIVKHEIENSPYWNTNNEEGVILIGDKMSYYSINVEKDSIITRFRNDPDQMLREQIITLTTSLE